MLSREKRFQIYPLELEHDCKQQPIDCVPLGAKCIQSPRNVIPSALDFMVRQPFKFLAVTPDFVNARHYFLQIDFPASMPLVKLINIHESVRPTLRAIINEFAEFYVEMYNLEQLTLDEEKVYIDCAQCRVDKFERFARGAEADRCLICSDDAEATLVLDCGHVFGEACILRWFKQKNNCPLCRQAIEPCACSGQRESIQSRIPPIENFFQQGIQSSGVFHLEPYDFTELLFTSIIYDRENNTFKLRHLTL
jgi:hypothetical protein